MFIKKVFNVFQLVNGLTNWYIHTMDYHSAIMDKKMKC